MSIPSADLGHGERRTGTVGPLPNTELIEAHSTFLKFHPSSLCQSFGPRRAFVSGEARAKQIHNPNKLERAS